MSVQRFVVLPTLFGLLAASLVAAEFRSDAMPYPPLPEAISSFGATVSGDYLYVFSGHMGRVPGNSLDGLSPHFSRLNLKQPGAPWEELAMQRPSQSPGLVAWHGQVYRVGGLSFRNRVDEETHFESTTEFARYNPESNTWTDLAPLPAPRSSLDAAVVDDRLYVVGGWNLQGKSAQEAPWHEDALVFDLTKEDGKWETIAKPPFVTRALAAVAHKHKLYILGGMNSNNRITRDVHVFDPATSQWSQGPELKGSDSFSGFAISAFESAGKLCYSGSEGVVYSLNDAGTEWQPIERLLFPRNFHRLLPAGKDKMVVVAGVARGGGYLANLELVDVTAAPPDSTPKMITWSIEFAGDARHGQALLLNGSSLYAFGGNRSPKPHDFSKEAFVDQAFRFDLAARTVEVLPNLPQPVQSAAAHLAGARIDQSIYVFGGLAHTGEKFGSSDAIYQYRLRSKGWSDDIGHLPTSRAMFGIAPHNDSVWIFGGSRVNTADQGLVQDAWQWKPTSEEPAVSVAAAALPVARRSFGGTVLDGKYYVVGGLGSDSEIVATASVFDLEKQAWSDIAAPRKARVFPSLAAAGGKLYLAGGFAKIDGHFAEADEIEVFDPKTNEWQPALAELPAEIRRLTMLEYQDRLLFYGVDRENAGLARFALIDPSPNTVGFGVASNNNSSGGSDDRGSADLVARLMRMDKNRDGRLTADEVGERFRPIVSKVDENQDGVATREEIEAYVKREGSNQDSPPPGRGRRGGAGRPGGAVAE